MRHFFATAAWMCLFTAIVLCCAGCPLPPKEEPQRTGSYSPPPSQNGNSGITTFQTAIGTDAYETAVSMSTTSDGGFIMAGSTAVGGNGVLYLVKTNSAGTVLWQQKFTAAPQSVSGTSVVETADKGFFAVGYTYPSTGSYPFGYGGEAIYMVRTDAAGNLLWEKTFSGSSQWAFSVKQTADGGYILLGGKTPDLGQSHLYLVKISASGDMQWDKMFGTGSERGSSIAVASDGGYVVAGSTMANPRWAIYVMKCDASGNLLWERTITKTYDAAAYSVVGTATGRYVITGLANNAGYLAEMDDSGYVTWERAFANVADVRSAAVTSDGGLVLAANGPVGDEVFMIRTDATGNQLWQSGLGKIAYYALPDAYSITTVGDGGYAISGSIEDASASSMRSDFYLVKTDSSGATQGTILRQALP